MAFRAFPMPAAPAAGTPAVSKTRTRRPGAGLSAQAASSPAMQPVVRRPPAKRFALSFSLPRLVRPRGCAGQFARLRRAIHAPCLCFRPAAHARAPAVSKSRTLFFSSPRLARTWFFPSAGSRRASVFPSRQKAHLLFPAAGRKPAGQKPAPNFHEYAKRGAKRTPTHRNARKAELCSFGFSGVSLISRRFAARRAVKPASSAEEGKIGRRAQASPFAQKRLKS